ncbi:MAG: hypothetical protein AAF512_25100 [Pseudomonadota bacterium]
MVSRLILMSLMLAMLSPSFASEAETPDLSGNWILVKSLSDDAQGKLQQALRKARRGDRRAGVTPPRGRVGGLPSGALATATPNKARQRNLGRFFWAATKIKIAQDLPAIEMIYDERFDRTIYTDGRGASISATGSKDQSINYSAWESKKLVVETTANNGTMTEERFSITKDKIPMLRIETTLRMEPLEDPVKAVRVYRPASVSEQQVLATVSKKK